MPLGTRSTARGLAIQGDQPLECVSATTQQTPSLDHIVCPAQPSIPQTHTGHSQITDKMEEARAVCALRTCVSRAPVVPEPGKWDQSQVASGLLSPV